MFLLLAYALLWYTLPAAAMGQTALKAIFDAAAPTITPAPRYAPMEYRGLDYRGLINRQAAEETCGYWDESADDPYTCNAGLACASNTIWDVFGCCPTNAAGSFITASCPGLVNPYTSCVEYSDADSCTGSCFSSNRVCDSTAQYCAVALSYTGRSTYTNFFCQSLSTNTPTIEIFATTTTTSSSRSSTPRSTSTSSTPTDPSTTPVATPTTPSPVPAPVVQEDSGSSTDKGAIAGGVIGGLAGLALIVSGAIFFLRRAKKKERKAAMAEVSQI